MILLLIGFALGGVSSLPIGALGAYMINRMTKEGFWAGFSVGLFAAFVDALYCWISLFGISLVIDAPLLRSIIQAIGLIVLLYLGGRHFFLHKEELSDNKSRSVVQNTIEMSKLILHFKGAVVVLIFALSNPTLLAFWINMANLLHSSVLQYGGPREYLAFSTSVGLGSALCQYVVLRIIQKVHHVNDKARVITRWVGSSIFVITIIYFGIQLVKEFVTKII